MNRKSSIFTLASVYIGTVIGAGFASGQEILQFFGTHGNRGILGVIMSSVLLSGIGAMLLSTIYEYRISSFEHFSRKYLGHSCSRYFNLLLIFVLLVGYFVMIAGSGAVVNEHFDIPKIYGVIGMSMICLIIFLYGVTGITEANKAIVPLLMLSIIGITGLVMLRNQLEFSNFYGGVTKEIEIIRDVKKELIFRESMVVHLGWIRSSLLYVSYNSIGVVVVMTSLLPFISDRYAAKWGGILGGVGLGIMALSILIVTLILYTDVIGLEVPMIAIASSLGSKTKQVYSTILLMAMFTTAIANGYSCILRIAYLTKIHEKSISIFVVLISIPLALVGFKSLVAFFYPLFGYLGFLIIIIMALTKIRTTA